jgi:WD40 repeat protein
MIWSSEWNRRGKIARVMCPRGGAPVFTTYGTYVGVFDIETGDEGPGLQVKDFGTLSAAAASPVIQHPRGGGAHQYVAIAGGNAIVVLDYSREHKQWRVLHRLDAGEHTINSVDFSPDGRYLLSLSDPHGAIRVWDKEKLAAAIWQWDMKTGKQVRCGLWQRLHNDVSGCFLDFTHKVTCAAFLPDGKSFVTWDGEGLHTWNRKSGRRTRSIEVPKDLTTWNLAAIAAEAGVAMKLGAGRPVRLWDIHSGKPLPSPACDSPVTNVAISADGSRLCVAGGGRVCVWDAKTARKQRQFHVTGPTDSRITLAVLPDGDRAVAAKGNAISLWDLGEKRD